MFLIGLKADFTLRPLQGIDSCGRLAVHAVML